MSISVIKYAFVAGEVSPTLFGRTDLEKYDLGVALARNFFVDYRGGLSTRPGTEFVDFVDQDDKPTKFVPFRFAPNVANTYVILFGHLYIRFIQDGAYVVEGDVTVTGGITQANPGVVTAASHGYSNGDLIYLNEVVGMTEVNGRLFKVANKTTHTFELNDPFGNSFDTSGLTAYSSAGVCNRVYTVTSPYSGSELAELRAHQRRDLVRLTHPDYAVRNLVRSGATSWALSSESFGSTLAAPTGLSVAASTSGNASVGVKVTAVTDAGEESVPTAMDIEASIVDYTNNVASIEVTWNAVSGADAYYVYRTKVATQAAQPITSAEQVGYIGKSYGTTFVDTNIIPDYTKEPPENNNPFSGAGNYPAVSTIFQQRQVYGATDDNPLTVWASRPGFLSNFDGSPAVAANDSYEFEVDSEEVAPIQHLVTTRGGLLVLTQSGIWQLRASDTGEAVTPTNALADPQSYRGCSTVPPIPIDTDLLYVEGKSPTVRLLSYNDTYKVFGGQDMSILSNHLFSADMQIVSWDYAQNPFNLIWAARTDGALLAFTLVKEQDVYAWTRCYTKGLVLDVCVVQENGVDRVYLMVKRYINGRWTKFIERMAERILEFVEDAWCVDCGLKTTQTYPNATLTPAAATGTGVNFTAGSAVFTDPDDVGSVIRVGGGKAIITSITSTTIAVCDILRDIIDVIPEDDSATPLIAESGEWTMDAPVDTISGLWHLEGETLKILADGNVLPDKTVSDGSVSLGADATLIVAGLGYQCVGKTMPPTLEKDVIEARRKSIVELGIRVNDTRGLKLGKDLDNLYEIKERTTELYGEPIALQSGFQYGIVSSHWNENGQTYFVQENPLPATVLGIVTELEVGDDNR